MPFLMARTVIQMTTIMALLALLQKRHRSPREQVQVRHLNMLIVKIVFGPRSIADSYQFAYSQRIPLLRTRGCRISVPSMAVPNATARSLISLQSAAGGFKGKR